MPCHGTHYGGLRSRASSGILVERDVARQLPIAGPDIAGTRDRAVIDIEPRGIDAEAFRRRGEEALAHFGANMSQRAAGLLDRKAARGDAFVRAGCGRGADHFDAADIDVELVRGDLGQRRDDALADLDLAGRDRDAAVAGEPHPGRQSWIGHEADRQFRRRGRHGLAISEAARSTARTMRLCDPQRHRLRSSAVLTSASVGDGLCFSRAAALIRIPETQ